VRDNPRGVLVQAVAPGSAAAAAGIRPGDRILEAAGNAVADLVDLHFFTTGRRVLLRWASPAGEVREARLVTGEKGLGITPEPIRPRRCRNRCMFCFVHQLPPGLRQSLYVKDEDVRLSFLHGHYVTLSDATEEDLSRIVRYRMSPLYVSVHTTDPLLRRRMLGNPRAADVMEVLNRLVRAGIVVHGQIVVCPGLNDGRELDRTLRDLASLGPGLRTVAVVPVGLTAHRRGLPPLRPVTPAEARATLALVERVYRAHGGVAARGEPFVTAADEYYLLAGRPVPGRSRYGSFAQLENGVGLLRLFLDAARALLRRQRWPTELHGGTVVTGTAAAPFVEWFLAALGARTGNVFRALPVPNRLFGGQVNVTGLLSGADIVRAGRGRVRGTLFLPSVCLREGGDLFLDGMSPADVGRRLGVPVAIFDPTPRGLLEAASRPPAEAKRRYNN